MLGVILSAGRGSRLLPLTERMPKCLVPVGGRAILDHQLDALARAGVDEAVVVGGYLFDQVEAHIAARSPTIRVDLRFNPFWSVSSSIGSVWAARDALRGAFCLMNGDTVLDDDILSRALAQNVANVGLLVEPIVDPSPDDMLVSVVDGAVTKVSKDLAVASATHRSLGVVLGAPDSRYAEALRRVIAAPGGAAAYHHDVVSTLAERGDVAAIVERSGAWSEIDRPQDIASWSGRTVKS